MAIVIGLTGTMASGKSYIAKKMKEKIKGVDIASFASPLKSLVCAGTGLADKDKKNTAIFRFDPEKIIDCLEIFLMENSLEPLHGNEMDILIKLNNRPTAEIYRKLLQYIGTTIVRERKEDFWVNKMSNNVLTNKNNFIVIDDVRMENEADFVKRQGFLFRINTVNNNIRNENSHGFINHVTEKQDFSVNAVICNDFKTGKLAPENLDDCDIKSKVIIQEFFLSLNPLNENKISKMIPHFLNISPCGPCI